MRSYLLLWFTQKIPGLGSAMTAYALVIWSYTQEGSALQTALLMLFLAAINLVASMYNAAFPAMMLSKASEAVMGTVNSVIGITMLIGSVLASFLPAPKSRVKAIWCCLLLSMCTENLFLAFGRNVWIWSFGASLGWIAILLMNANLEAVNRLNIPIEIQGRVFCSPELFSVLHHLGGLLVDQVLSRSWQRREQAAFCAICLAQEKAAEPHSCLLYCGLQVLLYV